MRLVLAVAAIAVQLAAGPIAFAAKEPSTDDLLEAVKTRARQNPTRDGGYTYLERDEAVLEDIAAREPENVDALHILAWIYASYPRHRNREDLHRRALDYARRAFDLGRDRSIYMYEILGAAEYANGNVARGHALFDHAIEHARDDPQRAWFERSKRRIFELHAGTSR